MSVEVIGPNKIRITDFRPKADTLNEYTGQFSVNGKLLHLHDNVLPDNQNKIYIDGAVYDIKAQPYIETQEAKQKCLKLDGSSSSGAIPHTEAFNMPKDFTVSMWFRRSGNGNDTHPGLLFKGSQWGIGYIASSGNLYFWDSTASYIDSGIEIDYNGWHFICVRVAGTDVDFWVDDSTSSTSSAAGSRSDNTNDITIGKSLSSHYAEGFVDDIQIYDKPISAIKIGLIRDERQWFSDAVSILRFEDNSAYTATDKYSERRLYL